MLLSAILLRPGICQLRIFENMLAFAGPKQAAFFSANGFDVGSAPVTRFNQNELWRGRCGLNTRRLSIMPMKILGGLHHSCKLEGKRKVTILEQEYYGA